MAELKPGTIAEILVLLRLDVAGKKDRLMRMIESGVDNELKERIAEYRVAYNALDNFEDWTVEQEG